MRAILPLIVCNLLFGQSPSNGLQNQVDTLIKLHDAWSAKAGTPGMSLTISPSIGSGPLMKFRLVAEGAPQGPYSLVAWPVTQKSPSEALKGVTLNASGLAICAGVPGTCGSPDKPDDPIDITLRPAPGEPVRLGLISTDGATKLFARLVPVPIRGEDHGCSAEATLLTPGAELLLITGSGFPANGEITVGSDSEGERHDLKGKSDAEGRYTGALLPSKQGVAKGVVHVRLKSAKCAPAVSIPWGRRD
ncbi:MAG TPA: hypothetical protein VMT15_17460 [Bryobacteraceae bacterium]|nr:hypothetical protein [Bryobacteraceae bacterium]